MPMNEGEQREILKAAFLVAFRRDGKVTQRGLTREIVAKGLLPELREQQIYGQVRRMMDDGSVLANATKEAQ